MKKNRLNMKQWIMKSAKAVYSTFYRFPSTIIVFLILAAIFIFRIETPYDKIQDISEKLDRVTAVLFLAVPFTLGISNIIERFYNRLFKWIFPLIWISEILFVYLYYSFLLKDIEMQPMVRLLLLSVAFGLVFLLMPYYYSKNNFEIYITKVISRLLISIFYTIVLGLGLMAILFAVKSLLYEGMSENIYIYSWIIAWNIFAPIYFLYGYPKIEDKFDDQDYNMVLKILLSYIVLPLITAYTVVLYLYFAKIIITGVWPSGIVSYLVVFYAAISIVTVFLIWPLRNFSRWVRIFTEGVTKIILPLLAMMFVSISIRISEFGVTENRYFILIIGLWATFAMIFIAFNKGKNNIVLFISLALICIITVVGPLSAFNISIKSQNNRFYKIVSKYDMLNEGKVMHQNSKVSEKDQKEITGIISYFDSSHSLDKLEYLPDDYNRSDMKKVFGFEEYYGSNDNIGNFYYYRADVYPIDTKGFSEIYKFDKYNNGLSSNNKEGLSFNIDEDNKLIVSSSSSEIFTLNLSQVVDELNKKYGFNREDELIPKEDLMIKDENNDIEIKVIITNVSGNKKSEEVTLIDYLEGYVLVKYK